MPRMPKQFKDPKLSEKTKADLQSYTEQLDFFFRCIRTDLEKLENVDWQDYIDNLKFTTGQTVIGYVTLAGTMAPDLTGTYGCDLGDPLYNGQRTYLLRKFNQDWWMWYDSSTGRWYLSYAIGTKAGYRWHADALAGTWTAEGGVNA